MFAKYAWKSYNVAVNAIFSCAVIGSKGPIPLWGVGGGAGSASRRGSEEVGVVEEREKKGRASSIGLPG